MTGSIPAAGDVTAEYEKGAQMALKTAQMLGCECAVLQDRSPSCGIGRVHNGLFDGGLVDGDGKTAELLRRAGLRLVPASDVENM